MKTVKGKKIDLDIRNMWRVLDKKGKNQGALKLRRNETVNWHAVKTPMEFRFPKEVDIDIYFEYEKGNFEDGKTQKVEKGKKLWLTVKEDAPAGTVEYDIEVESGEMVVGNSRPKLIIRG